jgi:uncharacterized protein (TIGR02217 family)
MSFFECEFPRTISFLAVGGPTRSTTINQGLSGSEQRNKNWASSRRKWQVQLKTPRPGQANSPLTLQGYIDALIAFFENIGAQGDGFRFFDPADNTAKNQQLATVAGNVQLVKNYVSAGRTYQRVITKPIAPGVVDYQNHVLPNTVFLANTSTPVTVDYTTGIVTGQSAGTAVDFQFDVPVRLNSDEMKIQAEESPWGAGSPVATWMGIELLEVFPPNY